MVNATHLKVLLKKDYLTLIRNKGFLIAFVFVPVALMGAFIGIQTLVNQDGEVSGSVVERYIKYTSSVPFLENFAPGIGPDKISALGRKGVQNQAKYTYSKFAVISPDKDVRDNLKTYFENYVLPLNGFGAEFQGITIAKLEVEAFVDKNALFKKVADLDKQPYAGSVHFKKFDIKNDDYEVEFSFPKEDAPDTNQSVYNPLIKTPDFANYNLWFSSGSIAIYPYITEFIARAKETSPNYALAIPLFIQSVGYAPMQSLPFEDISPIALDQLQQNFPFFYMIIYLIPFYYLVSKIAQEKESKSREGMKMMGLQDSTYFLSWFIIFFIISLGISIITTLFAVFGVFKKVDIILFFIFNILYSMTLYGWAFTIVAFLPTKRSSSIAATLFHIISFYLSFLLKDPNTDSGLQYGMSIFPNVCMNQIVKQIFFYNYNTDKGLSWGTLGVAYQGYSFLGGLLTLLGNVIFWGLLGIYLDQVVPSEFGVSKKWYFCCARSRRTVGQTGDREQLLKQDDVGQKDRRNFEEVGDSLKRQEKNNECLKVRGLVKKFGSKTAVNGTSLTMYNGQIFALLGHNGAGKTTTLSMLTGLIEPTEGCAEVFGIDIFNNMNEVRKNLGVCPQHDVLFEFLTAEDHLRLFAAFKGASSDQIEEKVQQMLEDIDLTSVKTQMSKTLSGGQKRKLSVAIAMIGDSKIVLLDEPTSGMDTSARRRLWEMLKKNKTGRIVILTTHYMDEADILGDRIAIMAEGDVQCTGSSLFLKNRYGVGYNLTIAKKERDPAPQIDQFIMSRINTAVKIQEVSGEISYQLPSQSSNLFGKFFEEFDLNQEALGVRSYGVGITTLEEVFLKIGHGDEIEEQRHEKREKDKEDINSSQLDSELDQYSITQNEPQSHFFLHLSVLTKKKILMQVRDIKTLSIDTIFPIVLIIAGLGLASIALFKNGEALPMTPFFYEFPQQMILNDKSGQPLMAEQIKTFITDNIVSQNTTGFKSQSDWLTFQNTPNPENLLTEIVAYDEKVFKNTVDTKMTNQGQIFVNRLNEAREFKIPIFDIAITKQEYQVVLLLNTTSYVAAGAWGAVAHEAILNQYLKDKDTNKIVKNIKLKIVDAPFPLSKIFAAIIKSQAGTISAILMTIAWMMMSDSLIQNIIKERSKNIKHQIMVSGSSLTAYWLGNYCSDILFQAIPAVVAVIGIYAFALDIPDVYWLFIATVFANPVFIYFFSFLFDKDDAGSLAIKLVYFLFGIIAAITITILQVFPNTTDVANVLRWFFYIFPIFSLTSGYMSIGNKQILAQVASKDPLNVVIPGSYAWNVAGPSLIFLFASIPFYWSLVFLIETKIYQRLPCFRRQGGDGNNKMMRRSTYNPAHTNSRDDDVIHEEEILKEKSPDDLPVRVAGVTKKFGAIKAVDNVSFGLEYGECFALLGVSGAGKTTCFKSLTGEIMPTSGEVSINGFDVSTKRGFSQARKMIGYCPQFDSIFDGLTVLEHLQIYAALKCIRQDIRAQLIQKSIKEMDLEDYTNIRANVLSGGNKRKLSVAMAIIGNPPIVFLDEPSTGVDPQAKRFMWNIVSKISTLRKKSAVIITTHSMEEAEALCTKMGIMVNGEFKCFGSSQHIKDKFGTGYEIEVKIKTLKETETNVIAAKYGKVANLTRDSAIEILRNEGGEELIDEIRADGIGSEFFKVFQAGGTVDSAEFIRWQYMEVNGNNALDHLDGVFSKCEVIEHFGNTWKLKVSRDNFSIGFLFGMMEELQPRFSISEYSVAQTTLEQIFNNFAIMAESDRGEGKKHTIRRRSTKSKPQAKLEGVTSNGNN